MHPPRRGDFSMRGERFFFGGGVFWKSHGAEFWLQGRGRFRAFSKKADKKFFVLELIFAIERWSLQTLEYFKFATSTFFSLHLKIKCYIRSKFLPPREQNNTIPPSTIELPNYWDKFSALFYTFCIRQYLCVNASNKQSNTDRDRLGKHTPADISAQRRIWANNM